MHMILRKSWPWWIMAGVGLGVAQLAAPLWPFTLIGIALVVSAIFRTHTFTQAAGGGWIVGTLKALGGFAWIWHAYPVLWLGIDSQSWQSLLLGTYWVTTATCMGIGLVVPVVLMHYLRDRFRLLLLIAPIAWVIGEVAGSLCVSVWLLGSGGYVAPVIGNGYAGLPLAQIPFLLPIAALAGMYGLTYVAAWFGLLAGLAAKWRSGAVLGAALLVIVLAFASASWPAAGRHSLGVSVMAIDTSFTFVSQETAAGRSLKSREVLKAIRAALAAAERPDVILLPEDSRFTTQFESPRVALAYLDSLAPESTATVVDSARIDIGSGQVALRAFYYDLARDQVYVTDKQFLTPQGEYVTYPFEFLLRAFGREAMIARMSRDQNYVPGPLDDYDGFPTSAPAILFCSESLSLWAVRQAETQQASPLVLHPISHGRFHHPYLLLYQQSALLKVQAAWNDTTIVSAVNMGTSEAYHPDGTVTVGREMLATPYWRSVFYEF